MPNNNLEPRRGYTTQSNSSGATLTAEMVIRAAERAIESRPVQPEVTSYMTEVFNRTNEAVNNAVRDAVVFGQTQVADDIVRSAIREMVPDRLGSAPTSTQQLSSESDLMEEALDQSRKLNSSYRKKLDTLRKKLATREERIAALEGQVKTLTEELEAIANEVGGI
jgi:chromosome segregation ATPase